MTSEPSSQMDNRDPNQPVSLSMPSKINFKTTLLACDVGKWDNHNTIARGWKDLKDMYHPVTFRKLYAVRK